MLKDNLPPQLKARDQWVNWDDAKRPHPAINRRLLSFEEARRRGPVGYVFRPECPYAGIDIDAMTPLAARLLAEARRLGAYIERSPSGVGWHIIGRGVLGRGLGRGVIDSGVEAYDRGRYFTMTGDSATGSVEADIQALLDQLQGLRHVGETNGAGEWSAELVPVLGAIPAEEYQDWVTVGMALKAAGAPLGVWDEWSRGSSKYPGPEALERKWDSFKGEGIGLGSLHILARRHGFDETDLDLFEVEQPPETETENPWERVAVWASELTGDPPPREWAWDQWIPKGVVTGLVGPPGVAKSTLALQLCVHKVLGLAFLGAELPRGPAAFITVEDDRDELHRRLFRVTDHLVEVAWELEGLTLVPATEMTTTLVNVDRHGKARATKLMAALAELVEARGVELLVLDLVGDFWTGNENARGEVTAYVRHHLGRLASRLGVAVLVIGHVNKAGEVSGSTAWLGSMRSAMVMSPTEVDTVLLERVKANYARRDEAELMWAQGYMAPVTDEEREERGRAEREALDAAVLAQVPVEPAESAYTIARRLPWAKEEVEVALRRLAEAGEVHRGEVRNGVQRWFR